MGYEAKFPKNFNPMENRRVGLGLLAGLLLSVTYLSPSIFYSFPFSNVNLGSSSMNAAPTSHLTDDTVITSQNLGVESATLESMKKCQGSNSSEGLCDTGGLIKMNGSSTVPNTTAEVGREKTNTTQLLLGKNINFGEGEEVTLNEKKINQKNMSSDVIVSNLDSSHNTIMTSNSTLQQLPSNPKQSGNKSESFEGSTILEDPKPDANLTTIIYSTTKEEVASNLTLLQTEAGNYSYSNEGSIMVGDPKSNANLTTILNSTKEEVPSNSTLKTETDAKIEDPEPKEMKPLCDLSNRRSNICDMEGEIRIHGKSSSVVSVTPGSPPRNESWRIKPYARKTDLTCMANVRELTVSWSNNYDDPPRCSVNHNVPAVIFSVTGYTGNFFHDFTDVWVPLFLTSYQFGGEVQFLIVNYRSWYINKYMTILKSLSNYELIDLDNDDRVHCFHRAIVGLYSHDDLKIDTLRSPNGYSMVDFTKFLRKAYSLPKESPLTAEELKRKKPRLLIVARSRTRRFTNLNKIVKMAEKLGFEVVEAEAETNVAHFAHIVNTCDVMMGVHGAGLTNFVFLPTNAILIQVVPWGRLDWIARTYFGEPSKGMDLRYLEYKISVEESTLSELYPKNDPVLKDPTSITKRGWDALRDTFLVKQNVKLNLRRFRPVLLKALKLLHEQ